MKTNLNVLLVGQGARECAMGHAISQSPRLGTLYAAPGNAGLATFAQLTPDLDTTDHAAVIAFCQANAIDLVVPAGETPLVAGMADALRRENIAVLGPTKKAAQLEGSKAFMKRVLDKARVKTARFDIFTDATTALNYLSTQSFPVVVKADGLAFGKGVRICANRVEAEAVLSDYFSGNAFGAAGRTVVIEEYLEGREVSVFALVDKAGSIHLLGSAQDYKGREAGGANTGGMGAVAPVAWFSANDEAHVVEHIIRPTLAALAADGIAYDGFLYAGLMVAEQRNKHDKGRDMYVLEYNIRLGDPEASVLLKALNYGNAADGEKGDFLSLCYEAATGAAATPPSITRDTTHVSVVLAHEAYPETPSEDTPARIAGLEALTLSKDYWMASLAADGTAKSGRMAHILGAGANTRLALTDAYRKIDDLTLTNIHYRRDIGEDIAYIATGKTKKVFADDTNANLVILEAIDRLTAFDAAKSAHIGAIGVEKTKQCANIYRLLETKGIATAFYDQPAPRELRCHAVEMIPLEFVVRRYAYGSYLKRAPNTEKAARFKEPLAELFHKHSVVTPPLTSWAKTMPEGTARARFLSADGWAEHVYTDPLIAQKGRYWRLHDAKAPFNTPDDTPSLIDIPPVLADDVIEHIWQTLLLPAFHVLETALLAHNIHLVDIKFEIGQRKDTQQWVIADVIDNDSWRIWPNGDPAAQLDKQGFREGASNDAVFNNYQIVTHLTETFS